MDKIYIGSSKESGKPGKSNLCDFKAKPATQHPKDVWKNKISSFLGLEPTQ